MNEPQDSATQPPSSSGQVNWVGGAVLVFIFAAFLVWTIIDGPNADEPRWFWVGYVGVLLALCLKVARVVWIAWDATRNGQPVAQEVPKRRGGVLGLILFLVVMLTIGDLTALATANAYDLVGFDVDRDSSIARRINTLIAAFAGAFLLHEIYKKLHGK